MFLRKVKMKKNNDCGINLQENTKCYPIKDVTKKHSNYFSLNISIFILLKGNQKWIKLIFKHHFYWMFQFVLSVHTSIILLYVYSIWSWLKPINDSKKTPEGALKVHAIALIYADQYLNWFINNSLTLYNRRPLKLWPKGSHVPHGPLD